MATEWISRDCVVAALELCAVLAHYDIEAGRGTSFRIHCPFHEDDRPSCSVNPSAKVFNCFACGEKGNVLDFIAGMEDLDPKAEFRAVLEKAIEIIGHNPTPQRSKSKRKKASPPKTKGLHQQHDTPTSKHGDGVAKDGEDHLCDKPKPWGDVDRDGVHEDANCNTADGKTPVPKKGKKRSSSAKLHDPDGSLQLEPNRVLEGPAFPLKLQSKHEWLDAQLKRIGVSRSVADEFGIGFESRSNALMANRVCFPIHNGNGELVAYAGRWASDDADEQGRFFTENGREQPRYRLPKGFHKQLELFNWHRVLEQFEDAETVVLVEGIWSVLRLQAMTIPSVALMGLSISDAQIRLLQEGGIRSVIVILDGDDEGQAAMETMVPRLASHFFTRSIRLPEGKKPDDCDLALLAKVKALCADARSEPPNNATKRKPGKKNPANPEANSGVAPNGKSGATSQKSNGQVEPNSTSTAKPVNRKGYALPTTKATASLNWSGFDQS